MCKQVRMDHHTLHKPVATNVPQVEVEVENNITLSLMHALSNPPSQLCTTSSVSSMLVRVYPHLLPAGRCWEQEVEQQRHWC